MSRSTDTSFQATPAQQAAAEWLILRDNGFSPDDERRFATWLAADPEHPRVFVALEETWQALDSVTELPQALGEPDADSLAPERLLAESRGMPAVQRSFNRIMVPVAAAAVLMLGFLGWQYWGPAQTDQRPFASIARTEVGAFRTLQLPDGSVVQLNTNSEVEVQYSREVRCVRLVHGEAHFTVAKKQNWPFVVKASGIDVRAIGTAFNVRLRSGAVEVLVTEGRVGVADLALSKSMLVSTGSFSSEAAILKAGERVIIPLASIPAYVVPVRLEATELQRSLAWRRQRLEFSSMSLADIVAEFNRYNRHKLVIADARLTGRLFGGTFHPDGYEVLSHLLETNHGIVVERRDTETLLKLP